MKRTSIIKITMLMSMIGVNAFAADIAVENADGVTIYYNYCNDGKELQVTSGGNDRYYSGNVVIPEEVTYMNRTRKVTSIGEYAFFWCSGLTSVTIPNSVASIGYSAFGYCSGLTSVTIPNSVTTIGDDAFYHCSSLTSLAIPNSVTRIGAYAFEGCSGLTSVTIPNSVTRIGDHTFFGCTNLSSVSIPNSVTSIDDYAFYGCSGLTSVTIPNSVTRIGVSAFEGCSGLTSVTIGNNVTSIDLCAFASCSGLTSVTIPNSVTYIGIYAFANCSNLTSVTIPNSVTSIGAWAFSGCSGLTSVTIGNNVTSIGDGAFHNAELSIVISLIENPFEIAGKSSYYPTFSQNTFNNATLYVPVGTIDKYKGTEGWQDFLFMEEGTGPNDSGETPETKKCTRPTISYKNGKLTFNCDTEGAVCQYSITDEDIKSGSSNEVQLGVTYRISVYATKAGYDNSETVTATLCWIDEDPKTEGIDNSIANVLTQPVLIQSNGSTLDISGADAGTAINVYDTAGRLVGAAKASTGTTSVGTSLSSGEVGIVKIGEKSVKVLIK